MSPGCEYLYRMLTAFVNVLPFETALRVWDVMLFDLSPCVLFRVLLTIVDAHTQAILACHDSLELWDLVAKVPQLCVDASGIVDGAQLQFSSLDRHAPTLMPHP